MTQQKSNELYRVKWSEKNIHEAYSRVHINTDYVLFY